MKKKITLILATIGLFTFSGCEDLLDVEPTTAIEAEGAVVDFTTLNRSALGAYSALQTTDYYGLRYLLYQDLYADNISFAGTFTTDREVASRRINASNLQISSTWASIYTVINRANVVIRDAERLFTEEQVTAEERDQIIGEMKFLRGLAHFDLLKVFGGVPVITSPTTTIAEIESLPRSSEAEVYQAIITDLLDAEQKLGEIRLSGIDANQRASSLAATALLARVYLQQGNNAQAAAKASEVITSGEYELLEDFESIFDSESNAESIFEINFSLNDQSGLGTSSDPTTSGQRFYVSADAYAALEESAENGDERFEATTGVQRNRNRLLKYDDVTNNADNVFVIRLAEMYLIRAEAVARQGAAGAIASPEVMSDINMIRTRAGLPAILIPMTNAQALTEILEQRRLEFIGEGLRFMDLKRYNLTCEFTEFCDEESFRNLWPIPLQQIEVNPNLNQNPGY